MHGNSGDVRQRKVIAAFSEARTEKKSARVQIQVWGE